MELKTIDEIKNGTAVFMPSGIRAKLFLEDDNVIVEYPELYRDKYTKEQFTKLMEEGIQILGNYPNTYQKSAVMENKETIVDKLSKKGFIRKSLLEAFEKQEAPGALFTVMQDEKQDYLTDGFKKELLVMLDRIAREYPNVKVRQQALTFLNAYGLQEYFDTKAAKEFATKYMELLNTHVNESLNEETATLKPFKFTMDSGEGRVWDIIEYGTDEENAKEELVKTHSYINPDEIIKIEPVKEDHEEVTLPFTMIHRSSEGPDASGEVTFFPTAFGYEYKCTEEDFNGKGPQWSTIRTIEGIKIWFRNVLFEFGAKIVTIGDETWDIDDFPKNESLNEERKIKEITKAEWDKTPNDYKMIRNGQKYIMYLDPQAGTVLGPCKIIDETLNEEQGAYFGNDAIGQIAAEIEAGNKSGYEPTEFGNWMLNTSMDSKWEAITEPAKDFLMEKIAMPVADGHVSYDDLEIYVSENSALAKEDIES